MRKKSANEAAQRSSSSGSLSVGDEYLDIISRPGHPLKPLHPLPPPLPQLHPQLHLQSHSHHQPAMPVKSTEIPPVLPTNPRKRPTPPVTDKPAPKRDRRDTSFQKRPHHVLLLAVWDTLCGRDPSRTDFTIKELVTEAEKEWIVMPDADKKIYRWRYDFVKLIKRPNAMFRKSTRQDAPPDSVLLHDREWTPKRRNENASAAKRGEFPVPNVDTAEEVVPTDTALYGATIPTEWKEEVYKPVRLSTFDKSSGVSFVKEKDNVVTGIKGYRTVRATSGVCSGDWFFEVEVLPSENAKSAVRVGWSMRRCDAETPVGFDSHGFGLRDRNGDFVHQGYRKTYGEAFGAGDVIGCRIVLPELSEEQIKQVVEADERWLKWRFLQFKQGPAPADSGISLRPEGRVEFYKNGKSMGTPPMFRIAEELEQVAKQNGQAGPSRRSMSKVKDALKESAPSTEKKGIIAGYYYPSVSLFKDAVAKANFGPDFKFAPPKGSRPMCKAAKDPPPPEPEKPQAEVEVVKADGPAQEQRREENVEQKRVDNPTVAQDKLQSPSVVLPPVNSAARRDNQVAPPVQNVTLPIQPTVPTINIVPTPPPPAPVQMPVQVPSINVLPTPPPLPSMNVVRGEPPLPSLNTVHGPPLPSLNHTPAHPLPSISGSVAPLPLPQMPVPISVPHQVTHLMQYPTHPLQSSTQLMALQPQPVQEGNQPFYTPTSQEPRIFNTDNGT